MSDNMSTTYTGPLYGATVTTGSLTNSTIGPYTITSSAMSDLYVTSGTGAAMSVVGQLELTGEKADVVINGVSLTDTLKAISERLNILSVNPKLEAEWDELRELGEQYRKLESELLEKQRMWETLKK